MKKKLYGLTVWLAVFCILAMSAHVFAFTILRIGGTDIKGMGVINHKECKSLTSILDQGSALANLPGGGKGGKTTEEGESATLIQRVEDNAMNRSADVSTVLDLMKASNAEQVKGDNAKVKGGDKTRTLVDAPLAVAGTGSAIATSPTAADEPAAENAEPPAAPDGYQLVSNEDADKIVAEVDRLKAETAQAQAELAALKAAAGANGGQTPGD